MVRGDKPLLWELGLEATSDAAVSATAETRAEPTSQKAPTQADNAAGNPKGDDPKSHNKNADKALARGGHRQRLRHRLLERGEEALEDYEVLEFLLFAAHTRSDTKPLAKRLLKRFGSLSGVLSAPVDALVAVEGSGSATASIIRATAEAARRFSYQALSDRDVLSSWDQLMDYCAKHMMGLAHEEFHLLFLDIKNRLIAHERQGRGTINQAPVYVREVTKRALDLHASALIMVHNHPSGDTQPSKTDIALTQEVHRTLKPLGVTVLDHVIIGRFGHTSMRRKGLI